MPLTPVNAVSPAASPAAPDAPGWYGKISTLGDFAHRRLPPEFIQLGDHWLSSSMAAGRAQFGERWLAAYLTAPVLRFAWAPGVADSGWWFGLLMPSCDSVGRYFPLLVAQRRSRPPLDRLAIDHLEAWYDHLAQAATQTLSEQSSLELFEAALEVAPPWPTPGRPAVLTTQAAADGAHYRLAPRASLNRWLHALAIEELHARFAGCTIWWNAGDATREATASIVNGLPDAARFAVMLAG